MLVEDTRVLRQRPRVGHFVNSPFYSYQVCTGSPRHHSHGGWGDKERHRHWHLRWAALPKRTTELRKLNILYRES